MAAYLINDAFIKVVAEDLPLFQSIFLRGALITVILFGFCVQQGVVSDIVGHMRGPVLARMLMEMIGTIFYLTALTKVEIAPLTIVMQMVPLAVTVVAARLLRERVPAARWIALAIGLIGVGLVVRPGTEEFSPWLLLGFVAVGTVVTREIMTRRIRSEIPSSIISFGTALLIMTMGGVVSVFEGWERASARQLLLLAGASLFLTLGYISSVITIRTGDISFSAPFRYSVVVIAIILQIVVFGDVPDLLTIIGSIIVSAAGLYALMTNRHPDNA